MLPASFKYLLDLLQTLVDLIMVGSISSAAIAAVGLSINFIMMLSIFTSCFDVGSNYLIARFTGARNYEEANKVIFNVSMLSFIVSLPIAFIAFSYTAYYFKLMGGSEAIIDQGSLYLGIVALAVPLIFLDNLFFSSFTAIGRSKTPLKIKIGSIIINIFLNYILIFGHFGFEAMGIKGAAIATLIAYSFSVSMYLSLLIFRKRHLYFKVSFNLNYTKKIFDVGLPVSLERLFTSMGFLIFVAMVSRYGQEVSAGYQIGVRIEGIAFMPAFGFMITAMSLTGQHIGARKPRLAIFDTIIIVKIGAYLLGLMGLVMIFFPEFLASFFSDDKEVLKEASDYLFWAGLSEIPLAFSFVYAGALRSLGMARQILVIDLVCMWLFRNIPTMTALNFDLPVSIAYAFMSLETFIIAYLAHRLLFVKKSFMKSR